MAFKLFVELQESALVLSLREQLERAQAECLRLAKDNTVLEHRLVFEQHVNFELTDILRDNKIYFRPGLDISKWK